MVFSQRKTLLCPGILPETRIHEKQAESELTETTEEILTENNEIPEEEIQVNDNQGEELTDNQEMQDSKEIDEKIESNVEDESEIKEKNEVNSENQSESEEDIVVEINEEALSSKTETMAEAEGRIKPFAMKLMAAGNPENNVLEGYSDYTPYLTAHKVMADGVEKKDGDTIDPAKEFSLSLSFDMKIADMGKNGLKYYFKLPEHISIGDLGSENSQIVLYNSNHCAIGTYFVKDDILYVTFPGYYVC